MNLESNPHCNWFRFYWTLWNL